MSQPIEWPARQVRGVPNTVYFCPRIARDDSAGKRTKRGKPCGQVRLNAHQPTARTLRFFCFHFDEATAQVYFIPIEPLYLRLAQARKSGMEWHVDYVFADAARRHFDDAMATLAQVKSTGVSSRDIDTSFRRILLMGDRGNWSETWKELDGARSEAAKVSPDVQRRFMLVESSLRASVDPEAVDAKALRETVGATADWLRKANGEYRAEAQMDALFAGYLAARRGNVDLARDTIALARPQDDNYPVLSKMFIVADAERVRAEGKPEESIRLLKPGLDGSELYIAHVALMDAYESAGDFKAALEQARWLAAHRGRAYAEYDPNRVPFNVVQSDLATLHAAEYAAALGATADSQKSLEAFRKAWPHADELAFVKARVRKLQTKS